MPQADIADLIDVLPGEWEGTARTWFEGEEPVDDSPIRAHIRRIGSTRFLLHEYEGKFGEDPRAGVEIIGVNLDTSGNPSVVAWADSFHMNADIMVSKSIADSGASGFAVLGHWGANPEDPESKPWGWRTEIEVADQDHVTFTAYIIEPDGKEGRATLTNYTRVAS